MKYIKSIKIFENYDDINHNFESCKDIIETISEYDNDLVVMGYKEGFYRYSFSNKMSSEMDKKALSFSLVLKENSDYTALQLKNKSLDILNKIDEYTLLLNKSKSIIKKIKLYSSKIIIGDIDINSIHLIIIFDQQDESIKKEAKIDRIYKSIKKYFVDYASNKTISISDEDAKKLYNTFSENDPIFSTVKNWNIGILRKDTKIRFAVGESLNEDIIKLKIGPFKFKNHSTYELKSTKLNKDQIKELINVIISRMINDYDIRDDKNSLKISVNDNIINIKIQQ